MRPIFRSLTLGLAALFGAGAFAQNIVIVMGSVQPCNGVSYPVHIWEPQSEPPLDTVVYTGPNCDYSFTYYPVFSSGVVWVSTTCDGGISYVTDSVMYAPLLQTYVINLACGGGGTFDCMGILNGPNVAGTPCDDGIPATDAFWNANCECVANTSSCNACFTVEQAVNGGAPVPFQAEFVTCSTGNAPLTYQWLMPDGSTTTDSIPNWLFSASGVYGVCLTITDMTGCSSWMCDTLVVTDNGDITFGAPLYDCLNMPNGNALPGTACTIPGTILPGIWSSNCICEADTTTTVVDCMGVLNGPDVPGSPCDDNNPLTSSTVWSANCECVVPVIIPCEADFFVMQALQDTTGNPGGGGVPIPNVLWVWNLSSGGTGFFQFLWSFGDGTSSTDPFPTHTYANGGPYLLCLTIADNGNCTDTYCDSVSVDDDGLYEGMAVGGHVRSTFTINVINPLLTGVTEEPEQEELATWPNPVSDELNIQLTSSMRGRVNMDVIDLSGRTVLAGSNILTSGPNRLSLPTSELTPGMYMLRIGNGNDARTIRFVKTR